MPDEQAGIASHVHTLVGEIVTAHQDPLRIDHDPLGEVHPDQGVVDMAARGGAGRFLFASTRLHPDYEAGAPLRAARGGRVKFKQFQARAGHYVVIDGARTGVDYAYMHLRKAPLVSTGQRVFTGQKLGEVGETGRAEHVIVVVEVAAAQQDPLAVDAQAVDGVQRDLAEPTAVRHRRDHRWRGRQAGAPGPAVKLDRISSNKEGVAEVLRVAKSNASAPVPVPRSTTSGFVVCRVAVTT